jgi:hypothetical protein
MYIPSYDFRIFELPQFSPLQAQEFGADTMFSANTPTGFIDFSINQLSGLLNPNSPFPYVQRQFPSVIDNFETNTFFQGAADTRAKLKQIRDEADRLLNEAGGSGDCKEGRNILGGCGPILGSKKVLKSDGDTSGIGTTTPTGGKIGEATATWFKSLPAGSGTFIIAVVVIILLLLFVKK